MPINAAEYVNPEVDNAANPSTFGYHYGPIPNPNPDYDPEQPNVTTASNAAAPNPASHQSKVHGSVCHVAVNGDEMCGVSIGGTAAYWRHVRCMHPGAVQNPSRQNVRIQELVAGQNALKHWVRSQGWRDARYAHEPGRGPAGGLLDLYATELEQLAREDAQFAANYGTQFHRRRTHATGPGSGKRKRGPSPPESPRSPTLASDPTPSRRRKVARRSTCDGSHMTAHIRWPHTAAMDDTSQTPLFSHATNDSYKTSSLSR